MREITTKVYKFDELNNEAQEKAMNWASDRLAEDWSYFGDYLEAEALELGYAFRMRNIATNGTTRVKSIEQYGELIRLGYRSLMIEEYDVIDGTCKLQVYHMETENEFEELQDYGTEEDLGDYEDKLAMKKKELEVLFGQRLSDDYESCYEDETTKDYIEANEYEFTEGGEIIF